MIRVELRGLLLAEQRERHALGDAASGSRRRSLADGRLTPPRSSRLGSSLSVTLEAPLFEARRADEQLVVEEARLHAQLLELRLADHAAVSPRCRRCGCCCPRAARSLQAYVAYGRRLYGALYVTLALHDGPCLGRSATLPRCGTRPDSRTCRSTVLNVPANSSFLTSIVVARAEHRHSCFSNRSMSPSTPTPYSQYSSRRAPCRGCRRC